MAIITKYSHSVATDFGGVFDADNWLNEVNASGSVVVPLAHVTRAGDVVNTWMTDALPAEEEAALDALVSAHALAVSKRACCRAVDARTQELIAGGFLYGGEILSLSLATQGYWANLYQARDFFTYPIRVNTLDDLGAYDIADATDVVALYQTALGTVKAHLSSGTALKDQVRAATTIAAVAAVVDDRGGV